MSFFFHKRVFFSDVECALSDIFEDVKSSFWGVINKNSLSDKKAENKTISILWISSHGKITS